MALIRIREIVNARIRTAKKHGLDATGASVSAVPLILFTLYLFLASLYLLYCIYQTSHHHSVEVLSTTRTLKDDRMMEGIAEGQPSPGSKDYLNNTVYDEAFEASDDFVSYFQQDEFEIPDRDNPSFRVIDEVTLDKGKVTFLSDTEALTLCCVIIDWTRDLSDNSLLSKLFQSALKPHRVLPYYFRMSPPPDQNDLTITTMITVDKFTVFDYLVEEYEGLFCSSVP
jgi:hypothetical protein